MWSGKVFSGIWDLTNIHAQCRLLENARCLKGRWDFKATQETGFAKISCCFFFFGLYMYVGNLGNQLFKWQM